MKKLRRTFKAIIEILKNPWLLNRILEDDGIWAKDIKKKYDRNAAFPIVDLANFLPDSRESLETFAFQGGGSLPTDLALLKGLSKRIAASNYFEIGTWRGESVANVADTGADCYTLDLSKEKLKAMKVDKIYAQLHGYFSGERDNITYLYGDSKTFDFEGLNKKFDLIFIDGDHHYEFVKNDTERVFEHLLHDKTIVVWHDYAYTPEKVRPEVMAGILDGVPEKFRHCLYHVSNTMCAIFTRESLEITAPDFPVVPDKKFRVEIEIQKIAIKTP